MSRPDPTGLNAASPRQVELFGRLRAWNVSSWRHGDRVVIVRETLSALAAIASDQDGFDRPPVPEVGVHALADQLEVLVMDAASAGATSERIDAVLDELAVRLGFVGR